MPPLVPDPLLQELTRTTDAFIRSLDGLTPEQWGYRLSPGVWSVGETAEHTAAAFRGVQRLLTHKLLSTPIPPGTTRVSDDFILQAMVNRSRRLSSPEAVLPRGRWANREELLAAFVESRDQLLAWCNEVTVDLRGYGAPHLVMGLLDGVQWLIFAAAHTERHTRQITELKQGLGV